MSTFLTWSNGTGLLSGIIFGVIMQRSRFCLVATVTNILLIRDFRYARAFLTAWIIAIAGTSLLEQTGYVAIAQSSYRVASINWLGAVTGGLLFGFGAALAGGCASRTIINVSEGHLGSLLALISMSAFAALTQYGALEPLRVSIYEAGTIKLSSKDSGLATLLNIPTWLAGMLAIAALLICIRLMGRLSTNRRLILAGALIGLTVVLTWLLTGWLLQDEFDPRPASAITITGPLARISYTLVTGTDLKSDFSMTFLFGMFCGACVSALSTHAFHWTRAQSSRIPHYLVGGALMGFGAIMAGGCNIGQGLSGFSTLSLTSILATMAIFSGTALGIKWWERHA